MQSYEQTYRNLLDGELLSLVYESESLLPEARVALRSELDRRGLEEEARGLEGRELQDVTSPEPAEGELKAAKPVSEAGPPESGDSIPVFSAENEFEARLIQDFMKAAGIESVLSAQHSPTVLPGICDVLVLESHADQARQIISDYQQSQPETIQKSETNQFKPGLDLPEQIAEWKLEHELASPIPRGIVLQWGEYIGGLVFLPALQLFGLVIFMLFASPGTVARAADWTLLFFGGFCIAVDVAMIVGTESNRRLSRLLVSRGTATCGIIVERKWVSSGGRGGGGYHGVIAYDTPARRDISRGLGLDQKVGDTLTVLYLPESPGRAVLYEDCSYKAVASQKESDVSVIPHSPQR